MLHFETGSYCYEIEYIYNDCITSSVDTNVYNVSLSVLYIQ